MKIPLQAVNSAVALAIYLLFFAFFFFQFPLNHALTGVTDSWFYVGAFQLYQSYFLSLFTEVSIAHTLYPSGPGFMYGDPCFFGALLFLPFKWLGMGDLWAWACMMVVVYTTNAFGAYLFFGNWASKWAVAFWAGLALAASVFCFGNIDSPNAFYLGTMFICLHYSNRFLNSGEWKPLLLAVVWGAATFYFSAYIFVFQAMLLAFFWIYHYSKVLAVPSLLPKLATAAALVAVLIAPYLMFLSAPGGLSSAWNPVEHFGVLDILSLDLLDLIRTMKGNLLYPPLKDGLYEHPFFYAQHAVFPGILLLVLAIVGYVVSPTRGRMWLLLTIGGFILAIGPAIHIAGVRIPMPMALAYEYTGLEAALRNPVRLWYLVLLGLIGLTLPAIEKLLARPKGLLILVLVMFVYILENVPFNIPKYNTTAYTKPDQQYINHLSTAKGGVVLELPSAVFTGGEWPRGLNEFSREYIYMYWQTMYKQNTVNGCNGFLPISRLVVNDLICRLVVVFHKNLPLLQDDPRIEGYLASNPLLSLELETPNTTIYRLNPQP